MRDRNIDKAYRDIPIEKRFPHKKKVTVADSRDEPPRSLRQLIQDLEDRVSESEARIVDLEVQLNTLLKKVNECQ